MPSDLRIRTNTAVSAEQQLELLLAQQAEIQAQIACLLPATASPTSSFQHSRSPIHKQHQQRRSNVPRSMSSSGTSMARHLSSDRIEAPSRPRTLSQHSAPSMARTNSRGSTSKRTGKTAFPQSGPMPPPLHADRQVNPVEAWANQDQPFNPYNFSHQSPQLQRSVPQRKPELEQVPEFDNIPGENPGDYLYRTGASFLQVPPSPISVPPQRSHGVSASPRKPYNIPAPTTPRSDSVTSATTLASNISRQNSLCNEPLLESIQMMKFNSNNSFSTDVYPVDHTLYDQVAPSTSSRHSPRSSNEDQSQLLVGAGGASHSQFSHFFPAASAVAPFHSSGSFGEKMEKSESNESTSSSSSTSSSRSKQRLQAQIAGARPLKPKSDSDESAASRDNSSQAMSRLESKDGAQEKIAISKPVYQRPKHERVKCKLCDEQPDGFRGEHELRRHQDRQHKPMVRKWVCVQPQSGYDHPEPILPLSRCKACAQQQKKYGAYYNAAAHLRRAHFRPKAKGRSKTSKVDSAQKRGGKAGGDWPSMQELKLWMKEVEEPATEYPLTASQQQEADESDEDTFEAALEEQITSAQTMSGISDGSFDNAFTMSDASLYTYSFATNDVIDRRNMNLDLQNIDPLYRSSQSSFGNFPASFYDDHLAFYDHYSPSLLDDQLIGLDPVNFS